MNETLGGIGNDTLLAVITKIDAKQVQAMNRSGRYLQTMTSNDLVSTDGVDKDTQKVGKPSDQIVGRAFLVKIPVRVSVYVHDEPRRAGFNMFEQAKERGQICWPAITIRLEKYYKHNWEEVADELNR